MNHRLCLTIALMVVLWALPAVAADMLGNPLYRSSDGADDAVVFSGDWINGFTSYRIAVSTEGAVTAGSLAVQVRGGIGEFAALQESIDLTAPQVMLIKGPLEAIRFVPSGYDGDSYTVEVLGWR